MAVSGKLTDKQDRFCHEYIKDMNATQACIRAGYSKKSANRMGVILWSNIVIKEKISALKDKLNDKDIMTAEDVLRELSLIGGSDYKTYGEIEEGGAVKLHPFKAMKKGATKVVSELTDSRTITEDAKGNQSIIHTKTKLKLHDKLKALDILAKHHGLFNEVTAKNEIDLAELADRIIENDG